MTFLFDTPSLNNLQMKFVTEILEGAICSVYGFWLNEFIHRMMMMVCTLAEADDCLSHFDQSSTQHHVAVRLYITFCLNYAYTG
jgi:hypothetical protein